MTTAAEAATAVTKAYQREAAKLHSTERGTLKVAKKKKVLIT